MSKAISFSLWGNNPKYTIGMLKNVELSKIYFPNWKIVIYCDCLVPLGIILELSTYEHVSVIEMPKIGDWTSLFWRYKAIEDNDIVICRDADSRLNERDSFCVNEWINSNKNLHSIYDHPYHKFVVMPGLFGMKKEGKFSKNINKLIQQYSSQNAYGTDYQFFAKYYDQYKNDLFIHDGCGVILENPNMPNRKRLEYCGRIFDENENTIEEHDNVLRQYEDKNKNVLYVHTHLGLGDSLDLNGMIRLFAKQYDKVCVFAKNKYFKIVKYMYRDSDKIEVIPIPCDDEYMEVGRFLRNNNIKKFLSVGHQNYPWGKEKELGLGCAEIFYKQVGIPFEKRFTEFYVERDKKEEERVYNKLNPNNEEYVFVHDDPSRGYEIDEKKVLQLYGKKVKIIRNDITENIFHFMKILEEAKQIHMMESSFKSIVEILPIRDHIYFHDFRQGASSFLGKTRQNFIKVEYGN